MVLAFIGLIFGFVPFTGFLALILGALAVLFGLLGIARGRRGEATNRKMAAISTGLGALVAVLGIVGIVITFTAVDQLGKDLQHIGNDPVALRDVTATDCSVTNEFGTSFANATVKITNSTDRTQTYSATISVNDESGARIGEINTFSNSLAAGQSVTVSGPGATGNSQQQLQLNSGLGCRQVDYSAAGQSRAVRKKSAEQPRTIIAYQRLPTVNWQLREGVAGVLPASAGRGRAC